MEAQTPLELHNSFRRKPAHLPPPIAAAKFARLGELLRGPQHQHPPWTAQPAEAAAGEVPGPSASAAAAPSLGGDSGGLLALRAVPGVAALESQIGASWHTFLHLYTAQQLAACVRAAGETGLLLRPGRTPAAAAAVAAGAGEAAAAASGKGQRQDAEGSASGGSPERGLVQRSLDVLLERGGEELAAAGPQAILDVAYGLMRAGHTWPATWRTLGPLLAGARGQLEAGAGDGGRAAGGGSAAQEAAEVVGWLKEKRLM
ncbi:hypothetical protein GPECTOR_2g1320 [Gonium pectorale]|uniref:Uncharacterized protein n=1 Tax=Gonium pectorale TaxID=33097 RepID=A0A150H2F1_GONPE|nr:hypothetical protein GPECTOR_2g1320 [Gonium pectorale]|eukprot:KXZ55770.1 hypothetical protein GPECTOR_2g1320 [Gonium pectorale]